MFTEQVGAWSSNRLNRLARAPKRYLTEPSLMVPLFGINTRSILRNGDLMGRLIDSFVVAQLRPELGISETMPTMNHLRLEDGRREIDILLQAPDARVVAIEITTGAEPSGALPSPPFGIESWLKSNTELTDVVLAGVTPLLVQGCGCQGLVRVPLSASSSR